MDHDLLGASRSSDGARVHDVRDERRPAAERDAGADAVPGPTRPGPVVDRRTPAADALAQIEATLREAAHAADPLAEAAARLRALAQTADVEAAPPAVRALRPLADAADVEAAPPTAPLRPEVEDATGYAGARVTPWGASIERRVARHRADGLPFAVLCLELVDADRLTAADVDRDVVAALEAAEAAIVAQLRPADALIRERPGRYWLTTPDTDASDGRALGHRIASAVADLPPHRGVPLQVAVGVTTCPADGSDARSLEDAAEEALFAARAAGLRVAVPPAER
jgi:GGDEF domain-containing protein